MAKKPVKYYVVDAFTDSPFKGNPAAVCFLEDERDDEWLQAVAVEFNLPMIGFLTPDQNSTRFNIRWFTTVNEVPLCGHATLAAAHILFTKGLVSSDLIEFDTLLSGILTATRVNDCTFANGSTMQNGKIQDKFLIELNLPAIPNVEFNSTDVSAISQALGGVPIVEVKKTADNRLIVLLPSAKCVEKLLPKIDEILNIPDADGLIVTGVAPPDSGFDFKSRFFAPKLGLNEDPVCGSAHCSLAPFWNKKLAGKCDFVAYQASHRSGILNIHIDVKNERVLLRGKAVTVMEGSIFA
ncbi:hypothetical protein ACFE04_012277 [Oxalis oulophora]